MAFTQHILGAFPIKAPAHPLQELLPLAHFQTQMQRQSGETEPHAQDCPAATDLQGGPLIATPHHPAASLLHTSAPGHRRASIHRGWLPETPASSQSLEGRAGTEQHRDGRGTSQQAQKSERARPAWPPKGEGVPGPRHPQPGRQVPTGPEAPLPTRSSCPKTVFSPRAEQFQRPKRNWYWHSLMPICAPSPITMMASGRL